MFACDQEGTPSEGIEKIFPHILSCTSPIFDYNACRYNIEKSKEGTARVVLCKELGILNSFTLESTYCGTDLTERRQITIRDLETLGVDFCKALNQLLQNQAFAEPEESLFNSIQKPKKPLKKIKSTLNIVKKSGDKKKKEKTKKEVELGQSDDNTNDSDSDDDDG